MWPQAAWAAAEEEQRAVVQRRGEELSIDALNDMEVLGRNMTESLRLFPPLIMLLRAAKAPFAVTDSAGKTFVIPKVCCCAPDPSHILDSEHCRWCCTALMRGSALARPYKAPVCA